MAAAKKPAFGTGQRGGTSRVNADKPKGHRDATHKAPKSETAGMRPMREPYRVQMKDLPEGWQDKFLMELSMKPIASRAARLAGVSRRTAYAYKESDPEFNAAWLDAIEEAKDKHLEICAEMVENGNAVMGIFLTKLWICGGAAGGGESINPKAGKTKHISVGWEE